MSVELLGERQVSALTHLLRGPDGDGERIEWKVLVYDEFCRDLLCPVLKVQDLRKMGITLHMLIGRERHPVRDAPAVYLLQPTMDNVRSICRDCKQDLYQSYAINFVSPLSREGLELMAEELVTLPTVQHIRVVDQFLNFVCMEHDLFSLEMINSYTTLHSLLPDEQMNAYIEDMTNALTSVLLTLQTLPVIVSVKNGAAQFVAEKLSSTLVDKLREEQLSPPSSVSRPVLVLCDRDNDLPVCMCHPFTYRAMLHELLGMKLNKVEIREKGEGTGAAARTPKTKVFELDTRSDTFWRSNAGLLYPEVAGRATEALERYQKTMGAIKGESAAGEDGEESGDSVTSLLGRVPQMQIEKKMVDVHVVLASAILGEYRGRGDDVWEGFYETGQQLITKEGCDMKRLRALIKADSGGTDDDRLRLFLIYYLSVVDDPTANKEDLQSFEEQLRASGVDMTPYDYLKASRTATGARGAQKGPGPGLLFSLGQGLGQVHKVAVSKLKQRDFVPLPLTRMVDAILSDPTGPNRKERGGKQDLYCHDPKTGNTIDVDQFRFNHAIVFVVGGGNYVEYQNLKDWQKLQTGKSVVYGCSDFMNSSQFLEQLRDLAASTL